ncbi:hypothetical protein H6P81_006775 [Aristolochia fimbriata]|uniref:DExH-box ATP-dependent RNA helicase DExH11 n=1 Tax=Aristolochia fimbriata TaxID=158543 RepID=A0AAV7F204_ARIFI|nr:hypothetical protein H6P81_006775 [Aristolochia fimbriata]
MDRVVAANELAFRIGFSGCSGHLRLEPLPAVERINPLNSVPDLILPPAFAPETPETVKKHLEEEYLVPELDKDEFSAEKSGRQWDFDWFEMAKVNLEPSVPRCVVVPSWELPFRRNKKENLPEKWNPTSVQIEVTELMEGEEDSGPLPRMPGPAKDFVRGSINSRPFRPGGLDASQSSERTLPEGVQNGDWVREVLSGGPALVVPPSLKQGLDLGTLKVYPNEWKCLEEKCLPSNSLDKNQSSLSVQFDDLFKRAWEEGVAEQPDNNIDSSESGSTMLEGEIEREDHEADMIPHADSSLLDEILLDGLRDSSSKMDEKIDDGEQKQKEAWALTVGSEGIAQKFYELVPDIALEFPFELDAFQKEAIYYLEQGESVFVAAHTSAGKTVVAEYAFALATKHCTRAVYTAPIKTISNQKYRDFCGKFDVGLLTGDVSLRPEASCLIMTTEILRSMLYRGADIIRDIEWVIFDEVHYVNDVERGVVWEEVIIMLPRHVNVVLLSATVPNTIEFADWIGRTKQKKIRVTGTTKRPVPLEHCLFYSGEMYKVCESETFLAQGLRAAKEAFKKKNLNSVGGYSGSVTPNTASQARQHESHNRGKVQKHSGSQGAGYSSSAGGAHQNNWGLRRSEASVWLLLINKLAKKSLLPVVIFCFSKNRCDKSADNLPGTDLTTSSEKSEIRLFCDKAFSRLKGSDRNLPQVIRVQSLLRRGIGVHHAGLLPIVKEVVEMLFCRGVIKVLFSTETFAMGVNAPARTVVFDTLRKFDGKEFRQLLAGEYTQMAGRAGRRGLDKIGTVLVMCRDEIPEERDLKRVMVGKPTRLESQFRLTYTMILHLLRVEELKVEDMLKRSFAEFHAQKKLPEKQQLLMLKLAQPTKTIECIKGEPAIEEYYEMAMEAEKHINNISEKVMQSNTAQHFLTPGRLVIVKSRMLEDHLLGVILKTPSANNKQYIVLLLKPGLSPSTENSSAAFGKSNEKEGGGLPQGYFIVPKGKRGQDEEYFSSVTSRKGSGAVNIKLPYTGIAAGISYEVVGIESRELLSICKDKIKIDQVRLLEEPSNATYSKTVQQMLDLRPQGEKYPPALDPKTDLKLKDMDLVEMYHSWNSLLHKMAQNKCHGCIKLQEHMMLVKERYKHKEEVNALKFQMSDEALQQMPDFQGRIDVLKEIGCIDGDLVVQMKGRVACEMNSGEELICTECLFENQLEDLEPAEAVAIMSSLVFQQKNTSEPCLTPKLALAKQRLCETAIRLAELQAHFKVTVNPEDYVQDNLKFGLVEVVYEWAKGTPFADICELTDVPEGLIVRTIVRLDETCREFKNAASIMGNSALYKKMEEASNAIKRDIVFAASLYVTDLLIRLPIYWIVSMSFYANQMQRGNSIQSISSREGSAMGSDYVVESGFYITSFAATVFLAALATVGVSLITVMVALTVMLQSCQNKSAGLVQLEKANKDYTYCKVFVVQAEINGFGVDQFPESCKGHAIQYLEEGQYLRDLNLTIEMANDYFRGVKPRFDGLDVIMMDIDDIFASGLAHDNYEYQHRFNLGQLDKQADAVKHELHRALLALHMTLQADGWSLAFFTLKSEEERANIVRTLSSAGYGGWSSLIMRSDDERLIESWNYLSTRRGELHKRASKPIILSKERARFNASLYNTMITNNMDGWKGDHTTYSSSSVKSITIILICCMNWSDVYLSNEKVFTCEYTNGVNGFSSDGQSVLHCVEDQQKIYGDHWPETVSQIYCPSFVLLFHLLVLFFSIKCDIQNEADKLSSFNAILEFLLNRIVGTLVRGNNICGEENFLGLDDHQRNRYRRLKPYRNSTGTYEGFFFYTWNKRHHVFA